ncbi:MAG TPA: hypothetical protein DDW54_04430, partial [Clostridiales bacterium]|nr:hypothetical protein [Clostridiales bacterium]
MFRSYNLLINYIKILDIYIGYSKIKQKRRKKTVKKIFITAVLLAGMAFSVLACGGETVKLPESAREKVSFAFNGVEKSFSDSAKTANAAALPTVYADENAFDSALQTIKNLYTAGDDQGDIIEDLEYDQPPMIQFQCLKAVFDKVGEGYSFGVKYYAEITGDVYFDMATGA